MTNWNENNELATRFVAAIFTLPVTAEDGYVGQAIEVEGLRRMALQVARLPNTDDLLTYVARVAAAVIYGTQHDFRSRPEWLALLDEYRGRVAELLDIPAVASVVPLPCDPCKYTGPRFAETPTEVDPLDAYQLPVEDEARQAFERGELPGAA